MCFFIIIREKKTKWITIATRRKKNLKASLPRRSDPRNSRKIEEN